MPLACMGMFRCFYCDGIRNPFWDCVILVLRRFGFFFTMVFGLC